jgi:hypothetical protein
LEIPKEIPDRFILDFTLQAENISWDSIVVVEPYSEPSLNPLKGFGSISSLSKSDLYVLFLYINQERVVGYSLVMLALDLNQLWGNSKSLENRYYAFAKNDAKFLFEKRGEIYYLKLDSN